MDAFRYSDSKMRPGRGRIRGGAGRCLLGIAAMAFLILALPSLASAALSFCPNGSGPGQCLNPRGLAVNEETERLYVADQGNDRVNVFEPDGDFVKSFATGDAPTHIAIDNTG